ncbi:MAG: 2Fe-2S iron-sulfur cluster-binding protein [Nitrospiria bacterium]
MENDSSIQSVPKLLQLIILGKEYHVPEDQLIWIFQDLGFIQLSSRFCWNGDCKNCVISYRTPSGEETTERACRTSARDGMIITHMPSKYYQT